MSRFTLAFALGIIAIPLGAFAQQNAAPAAAPGAARPTGPGATPAPLFFRIDWATVAGVPTEHPLDQRAISNTDVELKLYGPSGKDIQENGFIDNPANPLHAWTGICEGQCALAFRDKSRNVDLTGLAKIRWLTRVNGLHQAHPLLKLADGTWILGEHADGSVFDYHASEFTVSEMRWIKMDIAKVVTRGRWLDKVDLSNVEEIGFTDLMPGSGHGDGGYSSLGWVEVYGKPVPRPDAAKK